MFIKIMASMMFAGVRRSSTLCVCVCVHVSDFRESLFKRRLEELMPHASPVCFLVFGFSFYCSPVIRRYDVDVGRRIDRAESGTDAYSHDHSVNTVAKHIVGH